MADISGIINGTTANEDCKSRITWQETTNTLTNTGTVTAKMYLRKTSGGRNYSHNTTFRLTINGVTQTFYPGYVEVDDDGVWVLTCTASQTVTHNTDGSKSIAISGSGKLDGTSISSISVGTTVALYTIPRASTVASLSSSVEINGTNAVSLQINRKSATHTHSVRYYLDADHDVTHTDIGESDTLAIPSAWRAASGFTASNSATMTVTVTTYVSDTQIGDSVSRTLTLTVSGSGYPLLDADNIVLSPYCPTGTPAVIANNSIFAQGYTGITVTFDPSNTNFGAEAAITEKTVSAFGTLISSAPYSTGIVNASGNAAITVSVKDARGNVSAKQYAASFLPYSPPSLAGVTIFRCNSTGAASGTGAYISVAATGIYSPLGTHNSISTLRARFKASSAQTYGDWASITDGTATVIGGALSATVSYTVEVEITDAVGMTASVIGYIPTNSVAFNLKSGGSGAAFGKYAEYDNTLDSAWTIKAPSAEFTSPLPIASGGTGAGTASDALAALGAAAEEHTHSQYLDTTSDAVLDVASGGTGASTAAAAVTALGAAPASHTHSEYLTEGEWAYPTLTNGATSDTALGGGRVRYRKVGNRVYISGGVTSITYSGSSKIIFTLPEGYRPINNSHYWFVPAAGRRLTRVYVSTSGDVVLEWCVNVSDASDYTTATWLDLNIDFFID